MGIRTGVLAFVAVIEEISYCLLVGELTVSDILFILCTTSGTGEVTRGNAVGGT
jgi:hypothetical protein